MAPSAPSEQWPPRSPHEALVSTPKGREKYRRMLDQTSPSASPTRVAGAARALSKITGNLPVEGDEEDEETLQLKLQEIQARLRLKKLQSARAKEATDIHRDGLPASKSESVLDRSRSLGRTTPDPTEQEGLLPGQHSIQVPASPIRKAQTTIDPTSPRRVQLGIDKGLTARDVSLKRARSSTKTGYLRTSRTTESLRTEAAAARPSFSDRLASARTEEAASAERQQRIQQSRSNAFGISKDEMERFKTNAVDIADDPFAAPSFSREEILLGTGRHQGAKSQADTKPDVLRPGLMAQGVGLTDAHNGAQSLPARPTAARAPRAKPPAPGDVPEAEATSFEPYSRLHLKRRVLPHHVLVRQITDKKVYTMKDLLKQVKAPEYNLPDVEQDIVLFGIVAKKSEPKAHKPLPAKNGMKQEERGKFMIITLVDLEWEIELFLFNSGFTRFWKLTEGTVVAILNPGIMPPPPGRSLSGKFSMVISSDADTILEIGSARDLGFCQSVKKDGQLCSAWVNWKRTHFCEFHSNQALEKKRKTRMEVNSTGFGTRKHNQHEVFKWQGKGKGAGSHQQYDRESGTHYFASSRSAADLIDGKDRGLADQRERAENLRRKLAAQEKEMDIVKKLTRVGTGAGKDYMETAVKRAQAASSGHDRQEQRLMELDDEPDEEKPDAAALGLLSSKGHKIHLSPIKRKRPESSQASSVSSSSRPVYGWGSNLKDKLTKMKEGERLRKENDPPQRKKTRFVTDKGIREAGRESLGGELSEKMVDLDDDDDDDELVIVR